MSIRCGIDLGTTYSSISWFDSHRALVKHVELERADGANIVRSAVYYPGLGKPPVVGNAAWDARWQYPDRVMAGIKHVLGSDFRTAPIDGKEYTALEGCAEILRALAEDAEKFIGEDVKDVVISIPAYFEAGERAAMEEAGKLAELNVLALLLEPHAEALAYYATEATDLPCEHVLVYHLGGGTLSVALVRVSEVVKARKLVNATFTTLRVDCDRRSGGQEWDHALAGMVADKAKQVYGVDVWKDPGWLLSKCEHAKLALSHSISASIFVDSLGHEVEVTRSEFEDCTDYLLARTRAVLEQTLQYAEEAHHIGRDAIDVILAGGATKTPMVARMIEEVMQKPPLRNRKPELLASAGAAYYAHLLGSELTSHRSPAASRQVTTRSHLERDGGPSRVLSHDGTSCAVGIESVRPDGRGGWERFNSVVIPAGAAYGEVHQTELGTSEDNQTDISLALYAGDSPCIDDFARVTQGAA